ncbi:hypothetical protein REH65_04925 [Saccharopolyspora sp. ID03-671]
MIFISGHPSSTTVRDQEVAMTKPSEMDRICHPTCHDCHNPHG